MYTVNQGQKLATVGCYIMVTLPRAQGTHVKVGSKVLYLQYYKYEFCVFLSFTENFAKVSYFWELVKQKLIYLINITPGPSKLEKVVDW